MKYKTFKLHCQKLVVCITQSAASKKLAIFDAFEILNRIQEEEDLLNDKPTEVKEKVFKGFAEGRSK